LCIIGDDPRSFASLLHVPYDTFVGGDAIFTIHAIIESTLCAQQMMISDVLDTDHWLARL
jgi:hypothetical protein